MKNAVIVSITAFWKKVTPKMPARNHASHRPS
jgi:hypothetical protein